MNTIIKLSQNVTQYYKNNTSPIGANARIQSDIQLSTVRKALTSKNRKTRKLSRGPRWKRLWMVCRWSILLLRIYDQQLRESISFKLRDLDMRIQGSQNSPTMV